MAQLIAVRQQNFAGNVNGRKFSVVAVEVLDKSPNGCLATVFTSQAGPAIGFAKNPDLIRMGWASCSSDKTAGV